MKTDTARRIAWILVFATWFTAAGIAVWRTSLEVLKVQATQVQALALARLLQCQKTGTDGGGQQ